ncbi:LRRCT domain-containing protein [Aphelenchoides fujianensis]|nr:LRRCT domain-containing protein [Aphelenchoides fujianensis]
MAAGRTLFLFFLFVSIECREWDSAEEWMIGNVKHTRCRCHRTTEWERSPFPLRVLNCSAIFWPSDGATMREMAAKMREFPDCIDEEAILDLSHNGLVDFNASELLTPSQRSLVRQLDLSGNRLKAIDRDAVDSFSRLAVLKLGGNKLGDSDRDGDHYFPSSWIRDTLGRTLKELHLDNNALEAVSSNAFARLTTLEKLVLDENPRFVNSSYFGALELPSSLKELSLEGCGLNERVHMPDQMRKVESLSLARNELRYLPSIFRDFSRLRTLDLSGNPFERIDFVLPQVVELKMRQMPRLFYIGSYAFSSFSNLRVLDLAGSRELSAIHPTAFGFGEDGAKARALRVLNVENCGLMKLNSTTLPWTQLEELRLGGNPWNCDDSMGWLFRAWSTRRWTVGRNLTCASPWSRRGMEPRLAYDTPIAYTPASWQRDPRTTDRRNRWATTRQPRFPFWFAESTRAPYTDELGGEVDEWWARDVMPALRSAPHHPAVYFAAGAIASAVVLLAGWCCCQAVGCCFRRCCCPKPRSSWGVRNEAVDDRRLIPDDETKTEVETISNI